MRESVVWLRDPLEVTYSPERLELLAWLRRRAEELGSALGPGWFVHGSLARGDVHRRSDIDLVYLERGTVPSFSVELGLERAGIEWLSREIVVATPNSAPKGRILIDSRASVTFPLVPFKPNEEGFYRFGGALPAKGLATAPRVPGVSKRLLLVIPTAKGHIESSVVGREAEVARFLNVPFEVVSERVRVLTRRSDVGRTGVYLREEVPDEISFEEFLKRLADRDPVIRRTVTERGT
ncbi:MAG: nucleotidyltransferase domain-containing protein [Thermoplasmata archaeon]